MLGLKFEDTSSDFKVLIGEVALTRGKPGSSTKPSSPKILSSEVLSYNYKGVDVKVFFDRIYQFVDDLKIKYPDKNILIVAHAGILKAIECKINGMMKDEEIGPFLPNNCSVTKYVV